VLFRSSYDRTVPLGGLLADALVLPLFDGGNMGVRRRQLHELMQSRTTIRLQRLVAEGSGIGRLSNRPAIAYLPGCEQAGTPWSASQECAAISLS